MASLRQLRRRIRSVQNTRQITRAMQMVSAAKLRRAEAILKSSRPYAAKIKEIISQLLTQKNIPAHPLLKQDASNNRIALLVISGDKGLCGAFNTHTFRKTDEFLLKHSGKDILVYLFGKKGYEYYKRRDAMIELHKTNISRIIEKNEVADIAKTIQEDFGEKFDMMFIIYNAFVSAVSYKTTLEKLLPFDRDTFSISDKSTKDADYIFEPDVETIFNNLLPRFLMTQLYLRFAESATSEHSARMVSMQNATENASDLIDNLTLLRNKIRQATITKEISEIVGGAEALK